MTYKVLAIQYLPNGTQETRFTSREYETRHEAQMYADIVSVTWVDQTVHMEVIEVGGDENPKGIIVYTNAPPAYDYSYVEVIDEEYARFTGTGGTHPIIRKVAIHSTDEKERLFRREYQCGRYGSGLYSALTEEEMNESIGYGLAELIEDDVNVPPASPTGAVCPDCFCPASLEDVGTVCSQCHRGVVIGSGLEDHQ